MATNQWGADVPISSPDSLGDEIIMVEVGGGFVMTDRGLRHNITEEEREALVSPTFAPPGRTA
jgi:hypothetical protein